MQAIKKMERNLAYYKRTVVLAGQFSQATALNVMVLVCMVPSACLGPKQQSLFSPFFLPLGAAHFLPCRVQKRAFCSTYSSCPEIDPVYVVFFTDLHILVFKAGMGLDVSLRLLHGGFI